MHRLCHRFRCERLAHTRGAKQQEKSPFTFPINNIAERLSIRSLPMESEFTFALSRCILASRSCFIQCWMARPAVLNCVRTAVSSHQGPWQGFYYSFPLMPHLTFVALVCTHFGVPDGHSSAAPFGHSTKRSGHPFAGFGHAASQ